MPRLSIIVPAVGSAPLWEGALASVLAHRPLGCEVLAPHPGSYDDPYGLRGEVRFLESDPRAGVLELLNAAAAASRSELVHTLLPGVEATAGWCDAPLELYALEKLTTIAPVLRDATGAYLAGVGLTRGGGRVELTLDRGEEVVGPLLAAGFFSRRHLLATGGWRSEVGPRLADLDLALRLTSLGSDTAIAADSLVVGGGIYRPDVSPFKDGVYAERFVRRQRRRQAGSLATAARVWQVVSETCRAGLGLPSHLAGRLIGCLEGWTAPAAEDSPLASSSETPDILNLAQHRRPALSPATTQRPLRKAS